MTDRPLVTRIGDGVYRVDDHERTHIVHVAGSGEDLWVHWNGQVFHGAFGDGADRPRHRQPDAHQSLSAPMPATVLKVLVEPGATVHTGDTLLILEAMKMELPVRAAAEAVVRAVLCREGDLVQPGAVLVELE
ncbi:MAG TPA: biotin/lipoyl-containing protein [Vicinamibacterales bacterium]|nr:biotin/lipoyl-containing protein [Vicinamibacterales bacterium]